MSAFALISGRLFKAAESKTSKAGKPFASARVKEGDGEVAVWWTVLAFGDDAVAELLRLKPGDGVSVNGSFKVEVSAKDGESRLSHTIFADSVISVRKPPRQGGNRSRGGNDGGPLDKRFARV